jgi:hypothetical protein
MRATPCLRRRRIAIGVALPALLVLPVTAQSRDSAGTGDSLGRRRIQPLPALGSAPETGLQFGATVLAVWEPPAAARARPASLTAAAVRTAKAQTRIGVNGEYWTRNNDRRIAGSLQWQQFPLPFFGIGDGAPATAQETFTPRGIEGTATLQQRIAPVWFVSAGVRHFSQRITFDTIGVLRARALVGTAGGAITEWSAGVQRDTRDNVFAPHHGHWVQLSHARSVRGLLSDYTYGTTRLDARSYTGLPHGQVLAVQVQTTLIDGAAPFDQLALVGNSDILRGYARGRYRDNAVYAAQVEYRSPFWHRVGGVAFVGAGGLGTGIGAIVDETRWLPTYGAGVRVQIDPRQRTGIRADYGRGLAGNSGLYIGFNQAF